MAAAAGTAATAIRSDWAKDAPTDTAAEQNWFGDETSERDGDQKRSAGRAHAGGEKDEKQNGGDQAACGAEKRSCADRHGGADYDPRAVGPEGGRAGDGGDRRA